MGPHPAVAEARVHVRRSLAELGNGLGQPGGAPPRNPPQTGDDPGPLVLVACSGGADSLALAAAAAHEAPRQGLRCGGVTVDHGLQPGSAARALTVAAVLTGLGLDPVRVAAVTVAAGSGNGGLEAAAREARYAALGQAAAETGAVAVLLGHSLDDQAETVLLGLARGAGPRSLAGMPGRRGVYLRPLLGVSRATLRAACQAQGLEPWDDPHNADPAFTRARVRHQALPALEKALGPGVAQALARTAGQLRADTELLDELAGQAAEQVCDGAANEVGDGATNGAGGGWRVDRLAGLPGALRTRVLRQAAVAAGCPAGALSARHVAALDALVTAWRGQRGADLPGGVRCTRICDKLIFSANGEACPEAAPPG